MGRLSRNIRNNQRGVGQRVASMPEVYSHLTEILATRNIQVSQE
jgi:hypothetical protein